MLLNGPDQLSSLLGVLLRFRERPVAVSGDIAEMFHRIKIVEQDQLCQLILWRDADPSKDPVIYKMTAMTFGATCSPCSAQFVKNFNATKYQENYPRAVDAITKRHYVDDYLDSFDDEEEALTVCQQVCFIHSEAGFNIRNWVSNVKSLMESINPYSTDVSTTVDLNMSNEMNTEKILGMSWRTSSDDFIFKLCFNKVEPELLRKEKKPTKRQVLRIVMSLYDPLGLLSIITVCAKVFLQEVWRSGVDWDVLIPEEMIIFWHNWLNGLHGVSKINIPRCIMPKMNGGRKCDIHVFADASEVAFAAAVYLRVRSVENEEIVVSLIAAKTRVAPQKTLSIPRLELQGCVLGTRLLHTVLKELTLKIDEIVLWTDSQTVLGWIRSNKRKYSSFVSHRIGEILDSTTISQWRWVPTKDNVADDATRWMDEPKISSRWFSGPTFLYKEPDLWPKEKERVTSTDEEAKQLVYLHTEERNPFSFIRAERFSKWERLKRAMAFVVRYVHILRSRAKSTVNTALQLVKITPEIFLKTLALQGSELDQAEDVLFKAVQFDSWSKELFTMQHNKTISKHSKIYNLCPKLDQNGLIRLSGRLDVAPAIVGEDTKTPILLDREHIITNLIIDYIHRKYHHFGRETVINEIRQRMWIPKLRTQVNKVVKKCNLCAYLKAKPSIPRMAPLPAQRLAPFQPAFSYTGLDFFGPIEVTVGRRREKRWGVIFTCMSSRAIHLELASSLNTSSAVMCIRNFSNRRGPPLEFFSDNGTNLRAAEKELRQAVAEIDWRRIQNDTSRSTPGDSHTKWTFNPPTASHFGGIWERMIRTVKNSLYVILKSQAPKDETLRAALIEVENLVNSRPLTYSSSDTDSPESITPNHLIRGSERQVHQLPGDINSRKQWQVAQGIADSFWTRWLKEYLPTISKRTKWYDDNGSIKIGQLVLIIDDQINRGEWKRGVINEVFVSKDGRIRSAQVKTAKGQYIRPVSKLALLNVNF